MKRKILNDLLTWKQSKANIPLMLVGARQVGKTYILDEFCKAHFKFYHYFNLEKDHEVKQIFDSTLDPIKIIDAISVLRNIDIEPTDTVVFFDEIQASERAITSLKYFNEANLGYRIVCAGSLLGVALNRFETSYPVGKVRKQTLHPMDFEEFLWACGQQPLLEKIHSCFRSDAPMMDVLHQKALSYYRDYLYVGGMPASVLEYVGGDCRLAKYDSLIKRNIMEAYLYDMSKYTTNAEHLKISKLYQSIPKQLNREHTKFVYKLVDEKAHKRSYETSIDWLVHSGMIYYCKLAEIPKLPLNVYEREGMFKIYLNDVGLLCELAEIRPKDLYSDELNLYKGMLCENFIAQVLAVNGHSLHYWKAKQDAEIDFIVNLDGHVIPVEVKAATNTKSKSLKVYTEKYQPMYAIRVSAKNFGMHNNIKSVPLYAAYLIRSAT